MPDHISPPALNIAQSLLAIFFAIFWGGVFNAQGRWKMFHWPLIWVPQVWHRLILSTILLNAIPVLYFAWVLYSLKGVSLDTSTICKTIQLAAFGIAPAFAIFGFYRLWINCVEIEPSRYYLSSAQRKASTTLSQTEKRSEPSIESLRIEKREAGWNLIAAILYIGMGLAVSFWAIKS